MLLIPMLRKWTTITIAMFGLVRPALAGPPYVSDDPEPTDYRHFEIYTFSNGSAPRRRGSLVEEDSTQRVVD
jgi:hypothetical protein